MVNDINAESRPRLLHVKKLIYYCPTIAGLKCFMFHFYFYYQKRLFEIKKKKSEYLNIELSTSKRNRFLKISVHNPKKKFRIVYYELVARKRNIPKSHVNCYPRQIRTKLRFGALFFIIFVWPRVMYTNVYDFRDDFFCVRWRENTSLHGNTCYLAADKKNN